MSSKAIKSWVAVESDSLESARQQISDNHRPPFWACVMVGEIMGRSTKEKGEYFDLTYAQIAQSSKGALSIDQIKGALHVLTTAGIIGTKTKSAKNRAPQRVFVQSERRGISPTALNESQGDQTLNAGGLDAQHGGISPTPLKGFLNTSTSVESVVKDFARRDLAEIRKRPISEWASNKPEDDYKRLVDEVVIRRAHLGLFDKPNESDLWLWCSGKRHGQPIHAGTHKALFPKLPCDFCNNSGWFTPMDENGDPAAIQPCTKCKEIPSGLSQTKKEKL